MTYILRKIVRNFNENRLEKERIWAKHCKLEKFQVFKTVYEIRLNFKVKLLWNQTVKKKENDRSNKSIGRNKIDGIFTWPKTFSAKNIFWPKTKSAEIVFWSKTFSLENFLLQKYYGPKCISSADELFEWKTFW